MAWSALANNQFVTFLDAQGSPFLVLVALPSSQEYMTKAKALEHLNVSAANLASYASNQLVTKEDLTGGRETAWRGIYPFCLQTQAIYYNFSISQTFNKNNCGANYIGSSVTYTVAASTYSSEISQEDADSKARTDINANGQNYANTYGTCISVLSVGDIYGGGFIAYILQSGDPGFNANTPHGIIVSQFDRTNPVQWYNGAYIQTNATSLAIGQGDTNTSWIWLNQNMSNGSYAAQWCHDLVYNGYSDWYLPSQGELSKIFQNRALLPNFTTGKYWSSTELASDGTYKTAGLIDFGTATTQWLWKNTLANVRAIRSF